MREPINPPDTLKMGRNMHRHHIIVMANMGTRLHVKLYGFNRTGSVPQLSPLLVAPARDLKGGHSKKFLELGSTCNAVKYSSPM